MSKESTSTTESESPLFLGLDASTQALKASLLSSDLDVIAEVAVNFDVDLPGLKTRGGVQMGPKGSGEVYSPVESLSQAMDLLMERIKEKKWEVGRIRGVSAAGQVSLKPWYMLMIATRFSILVSSLFTYPEQY